MKFLIGIVLVAVYCHIPQRTPAQSQNDAPGVIKINRVAELSRGDQSEVFSAAIDLGRLPVGKKAEISLTFKNPGDTDVRFSNVSKKCSCSQFAARQYVLAAHGEEEVTLTIKIPARYRSKTVTNTIVFVQQGKSVIRANLSYELDGLLAFTEVMGIVRFDSDITTQTIEIPFLYSAPVEFQQVRAEASDELHDCTFQIKKTNEGGVLVVSMPEKIVASGNIRGEVYLTNPVANQKDCYLLAIKDQRISEISPKIIRFGREGNKFLATAIISIPGYSRINDLDQGDRNQIACQFQNQPIESTIEPLTKTTFRVQLAVDQNRMAKMAEAVESSGTGASGLVWEIETGRGRTSIETPFIYVDK